MKGHDPDQISREELERLAREFRYALTDLVCRAGGGHLGGTLSLVEIMITLYWRILRVDPRDPRWPERDRLVMSKGHAGPVQYLALARRGFFPMTDLLTIGLEGSNLPSHCDRRVPGVDMTTGSLGQGLSWACGSALAARMNKRRHRVFCILGDGDCNEGQTWEAAMFAGSSRLDNLIAICDYNRLQIDGSAEQVLDTAPLADKWKAFGWETCEIDGHDWDAVHDVLAQARQGKGRPTMIVAHTIKGKGHRQFENKVESHYPRLADESAKASFMAAIEAIDYDWTRG